MIDGVGFVSVGAPSMASLTSTKIATWSSSLLASPAAAANLASNVILRTWLVHNVAYACPVDSDDPWNLAGLRFSSASSVFKFGLPDHLWSLSSLRMKAFISGITTSLHLSFNSARALSLAKVHALRDVLSPEDLLRMQSIMRATSD